MKMPGNASSIAKSIALAALIFGVIGISSVRCAAAGTESIANPQTAICVSNPYDVTAYPTGSSGDVAAIALTTDMANPSGIARDGVGRIYVANAATNTITVYAAASNGNVPPIAVIGGANTGPFAASGNALGANGENYLGDGAVTRQDPLTAHAPPRSATRNLHQVPSPE